jgi:hypothetical protein
MSIKNTHADPRHWLLACSSAPRQRHAGQVPVLYTISNELPLRHPGDLFSCGTLSTEYPYGVTGNLLPSGLTVKEVTTLPTLPQAIRSLAFLALPLALERGSADR